MVGVEELDQERTPEKNPFFLPETQCHLDVDRTSRVNNTGSQLESRRWDSERQKICASSKSDFYQTKKFLGGGPNGIEKTLHVGFITLPGPLRYKRPSSSGRPNWGCVPFIVRGRKVAIEETGLSAQKKQR